MNNRNNFDSVTFRSKSQGVEKYKSAREMRMNGKEFLIFALLASCSLVSFIACVKVQEKLSSWNAIGITLFLIGSLFTILLLAYDFVLKKRKGGIKLAKSSLLFTISVGIWTVVFINVFIFR